MKLAFIGAGKMASAIAAGLVDNGVMAKEEMIAADISAEARDHFTELTGVSCYDSAAAVLESAETVILAVKPQVAEQVARPLAALCGGTLIISIAAGITTSRLGDWFSNNRVIRVMPNTPLMVRQGATVFTCGAGVTSEDRAFASEVFGTLGVVVEAAESQMDAVTALSGSGPAYVFALIEALVCGAESLGLPQPMALELAVQTVAGAAEMLKRKLGTPEELRRAVTSPGGTTAAGLAVLERENFADTINAVLQAAAERSRQLGS